MQTLPSCSFTQLPRRQDFSWFFIVAFVIICHLLVLWFSSLKSPVFPKKELSPRVFVKTIQLNPSLQSPVMTEPEVFLEKLEPLPVPPANENKKVIASPSIPLNTIKPETKTATPDIKAALPEQKKPVTTKKQAAPNPIKKPVEQMIKVEQTAKKLTKTESSHSAIAKEAEKKKQKELTTAKLREKELLAKAQENLEKMEKTRDKINSNSSVKLEKTLIPKSIESLQIDALPSGQSVSTELNTKEISYRDEVAYRLRLALRLPDYGTVKVKLIINNTGNVHQIQIMNSENQKNKEYIERTLPTLLFPSFGSRFDGASQYTFLITLNND